MKIRDMDLVKDINILFESNVLIWGAGDYGQKTIELLDGMGLQICGVYDKNKQGKIIKGHAVLGREAIKSLADDVRTIIIISSVRYAEDMLKDIMDFGIHTHGIYTYGGLKIAVELNIMSKKINDSFRNSFLLMRKMYISYVWEGRVEENVTRQWMTNLLLHREIGVLVFQSGKVGSSTLNRSLNLMEIPVVQIHFFTRQQRFKHYIQESHERIKIITLVREPIARGISGYFEYFAEFNILAEKNDERILSDLCSGVRKHLLMQCESEHGEEFDWFDDHFKDLTNIDIFQYPFNREKGYGFIREGKWDILVLKVENLNENREIIGDFIGVKDFQIVNANVGGEKLYKYLYADVKKELVIPKEVIEKYYIGNDRMDYFYTEEQKEMLKAKYRVDK
ncbi:MAG: hypothetical protein NC180_06715 [Muribaculaceae bacterium]|nr:hypothetical protein [Roseburia sp.]MCM1429845.1 hypothetical protein [Muribaculaceae bacterium]MCM1492896.1 hypothetical protein [Muribaculaceae bacterium]